MLLKGSVYYGNEARHIATQTHAQSHIHTRTWTLAQKIRCKIMDATIQQQHFFICVSNFQDENKYVCVHRCAIDECTCHRYRNSERCCCCCCGCCFCCCCWCCNEFKSSEDESTSPQRKKLLTSTHTRRIVHHSMSKMPNQSINFVEKFGSLNLIHKRINAAAIWRPYKNEKKGLPLFQW